MFTVLYRTGVVKIQLLDLFHYAPLTWSITACKVLWNYGVRHHFDHEKHQERS